MKYYNFTAYLIRYSAAIKKNLQTDKRTFIIKRACQLLNKFDEYSQHQAKIVWCKDYRLSENVLQSYIDGSEKMVLTHTEQLREFLSTFVINENEISGQLDIERNSTKYTMDELTILVEEQGLKMNNLPKLLNSVNKNISVVNVFNPLNELFHKLAESYKGEPLIHQLADCIKAYDFGDKENGAYQKRLQYFFHKWICKAAGQALHISSNDVMLLWVEPLGGSGKSFLNQWLFSLPEIQNYYIRISENESFMDMKGISKAKFAIDWDELPLSRKRYLSFKSHIAAEAGQQYNKRTKSYDPYRRQVNFLGSTNKANREKQKGYLLDDDSAMMRRICPIEIDGRIDYKKYIKDIDLNQFWGQASVEILNAKKNNNLQLLTWECDWDDLRTQNSRYINSNNKGDIENIIKSLPSGTKDNSILISATNLLEELKKRKIKVTMNEKELGRLLHKNGYNKGRCHSGRGWFIKF